MTALTLLLAVALVAVLAWHFRHALPRPHRGRRVYCCGCGEQLPVRRAVRIVDVMADEDEAEMTGGTAMVAEYHKRCAPPTCRRCGAELREPTNFCERCGCPTSAVRHRTSRYT